MVKVLNLSYSSRMIRNHNYDAFLASLFVPESQREKIIALYALDAELAHVREHVSEEMIAHMRYAWWEEALAKLAAGQEIKGHPVMEALVVTVKEGAASPVMLVQLAREHRAAYPEKPTQTSIDVIVRAAITKLCPQAEQGWRKASALIAEHRKHHGVRKNTRLQFKLLWMGK